jgi:hypothetical protein
MTPAATWVVKWVFGPLALALMGALIAYRGGGASRGERGATTPALEAAPALAVANTIWAFGTADAVKGMARTELDRIPPSETLQRARVFVRFGIVDDNFDGQAAVFGQACVADPNLCTTPEQLKRAVEAELRTRFVAPNVLPSYVVGHPHAK